jgi:hypothetical protein
MQETVTTTPERQDVVVMNDVDAPPTPRIRWGAVAAGMVLAVALMVFASSLWLALAFASDATFVESNLEWFIGFTAIMCVLIGGFVAARSSGIRGAGPGLTHGLTLWAVTLLIVLAVGVPSIINVLNLGRVTTELDATRSLIAAGVDTSLWATFIAMAGGLAAAALGGLVGGLTTRDQRVDNERENR